MPQYPPSRPGSNANPRLIFTILMLVTASIVVWYKQMDLVICIAVTVLAALYTALVLPRILNVGKQSNQSKRK